MSILYLGIDNGISGAIGRCWGEDPPTLHPIPVRSELNYQKAGKNITRLDYQEFVKMLEHWREIYGDNIRAVLEKPFVNPGNFVASSTSLRCLEAELIALETVGISRQYIDAKTWQKELLPEVTGREALKKASRDVGSRLFPHIAAEIKRQKDADAVFIAEYARRKRL